MTVAASCLFHQTVYGDRLSDVAAGGSVARAYE